MPEHSVQINRPPVLGSATVAERLGFKLGEGLSLGKAVRRLNAQSKGRHLGIFNPVPGDVKKARGQKRGEEFAVVRSPMAKERRPLIIHSRP